jgi:HEAT repeat protein
MQVNLLNYLRFADGGWCAELLKVLEDESTNDEVRFCCIRYFGKYHYDPAYGLLADFAEHADSRRIEYAVVSLMALRNYPCERTVQILSRHIHHPNWYIRYNATESMEMLGIEYQDLVDIFDGQDRYAREMLQYQFDQRYILDKEVEE